MEQYILYSLLCDWFSRNVETYLHVIFHAANTFTIRSFHLGSQVPHYQTYEAPQMESYCNKVPHFASSESKNGLYDRFFFSQWSYAYDRFYFPQWSYVYDKFWFFFLNEVTLITDFFSSNKLRLWQIFNSSIKLLKTFRRAQLIWQSQLFLFCLA